MKKLLITLIGIVMMQRAAAQVETTDLSGYEHAVYFQDAECYAEDSVVTLTVNLRATKDFKGFQFDAYFPEGAEYQSYTVSPNRYSSANLIDSGKLRDEGFFRILGWFMSTTDTFTGGDDAIVTFDVDVSNLAPGEYPLSIKKAVITYDIPLDQAIMDDDVFTSKLVVKEHVKTTDVSVYDDAVHVKDSEYVYGSGEVLLPVYAKCADDFQSIQFEVVLPDGMSPVLTSDGAYVEVVQDESRFDGLMTLLMSSVLEDGSVRVVGTTLMPYTRFSGSDANYCYVKVNVNGLEPGEYAVTVRNTTFSGFATDPLGDPSERKVTDEIVSKIVIKEKLRGDVNRDGLVNVADVTAISNIIQGRDKEEFNYDYDAADMNGDGKYDVIDITNLTNLIQGR